MAFLKKINFGNGSHDIAKTIVKGKPEGVISVSNTSGFENTDSEENNYSYDIDVNIDGTTIVKDGETTKSLKVGTVPAANVSVAAGGHAEGSEDSKIFTGDDVEEVLAELKVAIDNVDGKAKSYTIVEKTTDLPTNVAHRYKLQQTIGEGATAQVTEVGENIDILKDNSLLAAKLSTTDATWDGSAIVDGEGDEALVLVYKDANGTAQVIAIDVSAFLKEAEFGDGLQVTNGVVSAKLGQGLEFGGETGEGVNQSIKVKVDSTSEKDTQSTPADFLTVGADGIKVQGIGAEIDRKIAALDVTNDTTDPGKYVASIQETDGIVSVKERLNVSEAVLNNYAKGSTKGSIAATDTINQAFSKIEVTIKENEQVTSTALNELNSKIDGVDTDLTAEETRAKAAESEIADKVGLTGAEGSRTFTPTTNYGTGSTTVVGNMQALDTQLKKVTDKVNGIQYSISGTTLEFFEISEKTGA